MAENLRSAAAQLSTLSSVICGQQENVDRNIDVNSLKRCESEEMLSLASKNIVFRIARTALHLAIRRIMFVLCKKYPLCVHLVTKVHFNEFISAEFSIYRIVGWMRWRRKFQARWAGSFILACLE